jgi:integrase
MALLDSAPPGHRPILATLAGAGLRISEATNLDWCDINLATGR